MNIHVPTRLSALSSDELSELMDSIDEARIAVRVEMRARDAEPETQSRRVATKLDSFLASPTKRLWAALLVFALISGGTSLVKSCAGVVENSVKQ